MILEANSVSPHVKVPGYEETCADAGLEAEKVKLSGGVVVCFGGLI